jgi:SAM-dependent methyltransferase
LEPDPQTREAVSTEGNVAAYEPRDFPLFRAEELLLSRVLRPNFRVLDLGCGNGRVTRHLGGEGRRVTAVDLNLPALSEARARVGAPGVAFAGAHGRRLPFRDGGFDLVVFAYNGIDFLATPTNAVPRSPRSAGCSDRTPP